MNKYDPYHQCIKWNNCCKENIDLLADNFTYNKLILKYGKYSKRLNFTYPTWHWYMEYFFEDLPNPEIMLPTDCGVCFVCIVRKGSCEYVFKQKPTTYKEWYAKKKKEFEIEA